MTLTEHIKQTLLLSLPLVGSQLAQIAIGTTDIVMLGWDGTLSLASGVLGTQAVFTFFIFGAGFAHATVPLAAQALAINDRVMLRRVIRMGFWLTSIVTLCAIPILWHFEEILLFMGQDRNVSKLAADYIHIAQFMLFFALWGLVLRNFFSAIEYAQIVFWAIAPCIVLNALLNYVLIFGHFGAPALGVVGAAWASLITNIAIFLILVTWVLIHKQYRDYQLFKRLWRSDWHIFKRVALLGIPIAITIFAEVSMFSGSSILVGWIGVAELAAHGIALQLAAISFMVPLGISNAATIRVGKAFGRQKCLEIRRAGHAALIITICFALCAASIFVVLSQPLVILFLDQNQDDALVVAQIAIALLGIAAIFQIFDGLQIAITGILRGLQDATVPMMIALVCYGPLGIFCAYLFGNYLGYGVTGTWFGLTMGLACTSIFAGLRYRYIFAKYQRKFAVQTAIMTP